MSSKKWFIIGISGATCSGKTTLANMLKKEFKSSVVIHQDNYFLPASDPRQVRLEELNHFNWEVIESIDMDKMRSDIINVIESSPKESDCLDNKKILILEGFILFKCKIVTDLCSLKYFITLTKELCWERRKVRVYDPPDIPGYFEKAVWPEYVKHRDELVKDEDLCKTLMFIDGTKQIEEIFEMVSAEIKKLLS